MRLTHHGNRIEILCPAKLNLCLEIMGVRPDGYHELETVMQAVDLYDTLTVQPAEAGIDLTCSDPSIPSGPENLVWRAAELIARECGVDHGVRLTLDKQIPAGAGLGGGSSDAAGTIAALNALWRLDLSLADMAGLGARLGSDVSFFSYGGTALCRGRGEIVEPLASAEFDYVVVMPQLNVSTQVVYQAFTGDLTAQRFDSTLLLNSLTTGDASEAGKHLFNRLEAPAFAAYPMLAEAKRRLSSLPACGVSMSGSGSAFFLMCSSGEEAQRNAALLEGTARTAVVRSETVSLD